MPLTPQQFSDLRKQGLSVDQIIKFEGGQKPQAQPQPTEPAKKTGVGGVLKDVAIGAGKGILSTVTSLGQLALKAGTLLPGEQRLLEDAIKTGEEFKNTYLKPVNTSQKVGFVGEQIGEILIPVGGLAKGTATVATKLATKAPLGLKTITKLGTKALSESAEFAGKTYLQTAGDLRETKNAAITGAIASPLTEGAVALGRGLTKVLPEKLYAQIFKRSSADLEAYYRSVATGKKINPTLAKEMLDRGLMGNSKNLAVYSVKKLNDLEKQVQRVAPKLKQQIKVDNSKAYVDLLNSVSKKYKSGFYNAWSVKAKELAQMVKGSKGKLSVEQTLQTRRFLDSLRNHTSFKQDAILGPRASEFKDAANSLRAKLGSIPTLKNLINEERIFIQGFDAIVEDAVRRQNRNLLGLTDVLLGGGGLASGFPGAGFGAMAGVRIAQQPFSLTGIGQGLNKLGNLGTKIKAPTILRNAPKTIPPTIRESNK